MPTVKNLKRKREEICAPCILLPKLKKSPSVHHLVSVLFSWQVWLDEDVAVSIWGKELGSHLFQKWDGNLLLFLNRLDDDAKDTFFQYLLSHKSP
jgi:hypothetical protein